MLRKVIAHLSSVSQTIWGIIYVCCTNRVGCSFIFSITGLFKQLIIYIYTTIFGSFISRLSHIQVRILTSVFAN